MVCTENICRSPMAEGVLRHHLRGAQLHNHVRVSSAGTRTSQPGLKPDQRAQRVLENVGIDIGRQRSRRVTSRDLVRNDLIVAMDNANMQDLEKICLPADRHKLCLLMSFLPGHALNEVPDPYYGSFEGFEEVFRIVEAAVKNLISQIAPGF